MSEEKIWNTYEEFEDWMDRFWQQQVEPVQYQMQIDNAVLHLVNEGMEWTEAFDKVYTVDVLKKLGYLDKDWEQPEESKSMTEVLAELDETHTVMIKKESTTEKSNTNEEE